ncbi:DUF6077 domain-containing protein [Gordoniibacillus kamchatkensis]|uniref:DUF6077 domain-containing protein n=1 Tax=Gordoniibacillus kamchatkensis TaxID=1590651 RepID=UPI0022B1EBEF|nr:DUF6077 domain-containing protein [Paenibacillus sp. VKM B-2647]
MLLFFLSIYNIFGAYSHFSSGNFLLTRSWQGKSVLLNIVIPLLECYLVKYINTRKKKFLVIVAVINIAGISLSPTAIYICTFLIISFIVISYIKHREKKDICALFFSLIPVFVFALLIYRASLLYTAGWIVEEKNPFNFYTDLKLFVGSGVLFYLFLFSLPMFLLISKFKTAKYFISYYSFILFLLFINPITAKYIAKYFSSGQTYWRIFWLLPIGAALSYLGILGLVFTMKKLQIPFNKQIIFIVLYSIIIGISGKYVYSNNNNVLLINTPYKIPKDIVEVGSQIKTTKVIRIASGEEGAMYLRSINNQIELVYTRYSYMAGFLDPNSQEFKERVLLYEIVDGEVDNYNDLGYLLKKYDVNYLLVKKENKKLLNYLSAIKNNSIEIETEKYFLIKNNLINL